MKKARVLAASLAVTAAVACGIFWAAAPRTAYPCVQEYVPGQGNIQGSVDVQRYLALDSSFAIGANADGYAVFKDPHAALKTLEAMYPDALKLIREEYGLTPLVSVQYAAYKIYGWQVTTGTPELRKQALFISEFMDIYENSFEPPL